KIASDVEAPDPGVLRRKLAGAGDVFPVKALLGVMAGPEITDAQIDDFIAGYVTPVDTDEEQEAAGPAWEFVEVGGIRVRYARRGNAEGGKLPVLFIHGFGGDLDNWLFNIDAVGAQNPVIALDLPAHGQSSLRLAGTTLAELGRFIAGFLDALQVPRVHVVGHSLGGAIAAQLALDSPARVASLSLIATAGLGPEINAGYLSGYVAANSRRDLKPVVEQLFADANLVSRQMLDDLLKYKRLDGVGEALTKLAAALFPAGQQAALPVQGLATTDIPLLLIWGAEDRIIPASHTALSPKGAKVMVLPGAGHMVQMEKAGEVNALLKAQVS
ncbi:MAG: acetoin dehydrogenase dihydrolipoyllysine-residue acetyltransferase subunit, partial [Proteobacteria bacterium]|nr:acetoin dehydrogenase dihydrolipoyllysine-residue acetyltransferase subunit [Pseudomonadota bacterium]